ncbi:hypothetical protein ACFVYJ_01835 [Pontibacter sp. JAM-7]|uniref:hypothetical protein n=1 Tax=Pontibacter sp. JAM-7 TaxID=3366581 RepID=UPI003AF4332E
MRNFTLLALTALTLSGCDADIPATDYFPLHAGVRWEYKVTENLTDRVNERRFSIENRGTAQLKGRYADEPVSIRHTSDGTDYYILQDDTGSYRIARRTMIEYDPRYEEEEVRILPNYKDLDLGRNWSAVTRPYALHSLPSYAVEEPGGKMVNMEFEITALDDTVTVPAGTFAGCIRVVGKAKINLYADPKIGYQDVKLTQTEWYAPGVGLVKLVRDEPLDLDIFKGGTISFELVSFDP